MSDWTRKDGDEDGDGNEEDEETPTRPGAYKRRVGKEDGKGAKKQRTTRPERTRVYEVVAVVRRKVVFALR